MTRYCHKLWTVLCFTTFCVFGAVKAQSPVRTCETPRYEEGQCIILIQCEPLLDLLKKRPVSAEDTDYLRRSACGFEGSNPKVCCPTFRSVNNGAVQQRPTVPLPFTTTASVPYSRGPGEQNSLLPGPDTCGLADDDKVVGGEVAGLREFPWMALIEYQTNSGFGFYCGGVLINNRYVLTAAHCVKGKDLPPTWKLTRVRLGEFNTDTAIDCDTIKFNNQRECAPDPVDVAVERTIAHEQYDPLSTDQYNDIALLRLTKTVNVTNFVRPVCLPSSQELASRSFVGDLMYVAGWGKTETRSASNVKLKLRIKVKSNEECGSVYKTARVTIGDGQLCAGGEKGKDSCRGDSGGALMASLTTAGKGNWYAFGVVSFGPSPCGMENWPGVYTRVTNYVDWIYDKIRT